MRQFDPLKNAEWRDIGAVTPYHLNAKKHTDDQVAGLASEIAALGFDQPILVDGDGIIIAGHGRRLAALRLGMSRIPVIVRTDLTPSQVEARRLADNEWARGEFDEGLRTLAVRAVHEAGEVDLGILGIPTVELDGMIAQVEAVDMPPLPDGDREPFQTMSFTLSDDQAGEVKRAIEAAHKLGGYGETCNTNKNGNALARICETFNTRHAQR